MLSPGATVGSLAPDFTLPDQTGSPVRLSTLLAKGPVMVVFYPGDFTRVCTKQLCNYRDNLAEFQNLGVQLVGVSADSPEEHETFAQVYRFTFPLLSDENHAVTKQYGATSMVMLGGTSRAVYVISRSGHVVYRYVEPTVLSRRSAGELTEVLHRLREQKAI